MPRNFTNLDTATHIAGVCVVVHGRHIQRCVICGEKLADSEDPKLTTIWAEVEAIRAKDGVLYRTGKDMDNMRRRLPRDLCNELVER